VQENSSLRDKLGKLKDYFVMSEAEQRADKEKMIRLINEQSNVSRLTDDIDRLTQVCFSYCAFIFLFILRQLSLFFLKGFDKMKTKSAIEERKPLPTLC